MSYPVDEILKVLIVAAICFMIALMWTPALIRWLKKKKMGKSIRDASSAPVMAHFHAAKAGTPTMGGLVIWVTVLAVIVLLHYGCTLFGIGTVCYLNFLSRGQTLLPLGAFVAAALVGLLDDYLNIKKIGPKGGGLRVRHRLMSYSLIALGAAWWFFSKLDWDAIHIPFDGDLSLGWWYIPFFAIVIVATSFSVNETDGLDGLAGGTLLAAFGAYGVIAFSQGKIDLAVFCAAIVGALLAFVWHNITPAAFFMGDTGAMAMGTVLGVVAMLTNQPLLLFIIGLPFVIESGSVLLQVTSKKLRGGKKIFKSSPLHHHFEAIGWGEPKIVMRFWVLAFVCAAVGTAIALVDKM
ncbi:MAG: phospho-N-acetylmuramoyl-pentapeptide-transferase [Patescibacteria group bacterium]|nr:phospho-N-acetylmuramoyl-pentapeptide-transferase [Patescibacteria group bacterium]MBU2508933.1 phospho-N-acetylmuramoyl-pentapeptide-transferase [Patescibacteria group bacterium]